MTSDQRHWDNAYGRSATAVSWHQTEASKSLELLASTELALDAPLIDIGGGASTLVDGLLELGFRDLTVLDISRTALDSARQRLGEAAGSVDWVATDLLTWSPPRCYALWHDRAVLHFLTEEHQRESYLEVMRNALEPGGFAVIGVFAEDGPEKCSGLDVRRYSPGDLEAFLGETFSVMATSDEDHTTPSGNTQHFNWIVARRRDEGISDPT